MSIAEVKEELAEKVARIAVLEHRIEEASKHLVVLQESQQQLISRFDKYEGKLGGIFLVIGALVAFVKLFGPWVSSLLNGNGGK